MRRILTILVLLGLAGCSGEGIGFGRLDVTPALQEACAGVAGGDPFIGTLLHLAEEARLVGVTFGELFDSTIDTCTFEACITCDLAVLNQIYGT